MMSVSGVVQEGPGEAAVAALGEATETPERLWTAGMRAIAAEEVSHLAAQAHAAQVHLPTLPLHPSVTFPDASRVAVHGLTAEL